MKTTKSKAAYTNKWLFRNRHLWHETTVNGTKIIILHKQDAPRIVVERVKEINHKRGYGSSINTCLRSLVGDTSYASHKSPFMSIYTEEELKEMEEADSSYDDEEDIDYDEYDEYYDDDLK